MLGLAGAAFKKSSHIDAVDTVLLFFEAECQNHALACGIWQHLCLMNTAKVNKVHGLTPHDEQSFKIVNPLGGYEVFDQTELIV